MNERTNNRKMSMEWLKKYCTTIIKTKQAHAFLLRNHLFHLNVAASKLISFLAISDSGNLNYAHQIFTHLENPDVYIWNTMIRGYARTSSYSAISLYHLMIQQSQREERAAAIPDHFTYTFILTACARLPSLEFGRRFHGVAIKSGLQLDVYLLNSLIQMYTACDCFEAASNLFDESPVRDVVTWNVMIGAQINKGFYKQAFNLFNKMREDDDDDNVKPDAVTIINMVSACTQLGDFGQGALLHSYSKEMGLEKNLRVCNAIINMYCKCGDLGSAQLVFDNMPERDVLTWTSMISGLANSGYFMESLVLFGQMQFSKIQPDEVTLVSVLSACAQTGALDQGKYIHLLIQRYKVNNDVVLETALVDMYAKCGSIDLALQVFNKIRIKNVFTWNTMIGGLAVNGHGLHAMLLFKEMKHERITPDEVTFIGLLCACGHTGLVDKGLEIFKQMKELYCIEPRMEHYGCMVDLLCRAQLVDEAYAFIENMPIKANEVVWATLLLGARRTGGHFELAEKVGRRVIELEPDSCGRYVMLSSLYAGMNQWDKALKIQTDMKLKGIQKTPGYSWIEINGIVHQFSAGDRLHVQTEEIYMMVEEMCERVKLSGGHVPGTTAVLFDIEEEEKEHSLCLHSEKLAIALGLISTPPGSTIRIVKNLRVCNDCHSFIKIISKVFERLIIARDRSRFHHFSHGSCSCKDFW